MKFLKQFYDRFWSLKKWKKTAILLVVCLTVLYIFSLPKPLFDTPYSTLVTDHTGEMLGARIAPDGQWRFPPTDTLSPKYERCLIRYEDRNFRFHPGVNPLSLGRALLQNLKAGRVVSGGSTITMQTVRLMRRNKRTYFEKIAEIIIATRLELSFSKKKILALYASHAPMGGNVVGVDAAAWRYFGHDAATLSWAEAATLAVLPNSPAMMHFGKNRDQLLNKRNNLLLDIYSTGMISEMDYQLAVAEPLPDNAQPLPQIAPHLVAALHRSHPGKSIKSTIQKNLQLQSEEVLKRWNREFAQNNIHNMAALIVDLSRNEVVSYVGNVNFDKPGFGNQVDIVQSPRSTGSILKPFLYAALLQEGKLLPTELLPDVPVNIGGFSPKNFSLQYDGAAHADEALARSLNIPAVVSLSRYGVSKFHHLLKQSGMTTLNKPPDYYGLSLILGGAEGTLWDVASLYAQLVYALTMKEEKSVHSFRISENNVSDKRKKEILFTPSAAWQTLEALTRVNRPEEIDWEFIPSMQKIAWKTGTSFGFRDAWAIGITPRYLVAVWTGNSNGEGRPGLTGARTSARVMFDLFNLLPATNWFEPPYNELIEVEICRESGLLASINCPESSKETILANPNAQHASVCNYHQIVHLSEDMKYRVYEACAGERGIVRSAWFVLPPSWEWYYKQHHTNYRPLPPFAPECNKINPESAMQFIYPYQNMTIKLPKQLDGSIGKTIFELAHRNPLAKIFWHLDEEYLGETSDVHQMELSPRPGEHTVTAVDQEGNVQQIKFKIE